MNDIGMDILKTLLGRDNLRFFFEKLYFIFVLTGNSLGGCQSWSCRKWKKGQRRLFFFSLFLLLPQSCMSFPSFDSFLPFRRRRRRCQMQMLCMWEVFSLSNHCCCRRRLYRLKRSGAYMSSALLSVDLCPSLSSFLYVQKNLFFFFLDTTETASNIT